MDATYPWDLLTVSFDLFESDLVEDDQCIASTATVHETAVVREPTVVAPDCEIGPGAIVGPYVCLGENVTVGSNAVVEHSVVDMDTRIGASATVVDCVTGVGVEIGNGTTIPGGPGDVRVEDRVFEDEQLGRCSQITSTIRVGVRTYPARSSAPIRPSLPAQLSVVHS